MQAHSLHLAGVLSLLKTCVRAALLRTPPTIERYDDYAHSYSSDAHPIEARKTALLPVKVPSSELEHQSHYLTLTRPREHVLSSRVMPEGTNF